MSLPNPKDLAKLAAACRKAGITYFKADGIEFQLSPVVSKTLTKSHAPTPDPISEDTLTGDSLLFWSSQEIPVPSDKEGTS